MTKCIFGDWTCYNSNRIKKCRENMEKAEKWNNMMEQSMEAPYIDCIDNLKKLEAVKKWLIKAKAEGRISMSSGFTLSEILGVEEA